MKITNKGLRILFVKFHDYLRFLNLSMWKKLPIIVSRMVADKGMLNFAKKELTWA